MTQSGMGRLRAALAAPLISDMREMARPYGPLVDQANCSGSLTAFARFLSFAFIGLPAT